MPTILGPGFGDGNTSSAQFPAGLLPATVDLYQYSVSSGWNGQYSDTNPTSLSGKTHSSQAPGVIRLNPTEKGSGTDPNINTFWEQIDSHGNITSYTDTGFKNNQGLILLATFVIPYAGQYSMDVASDDGYFFGWGGGPGTITRISGPQTNSIGQTVTANKGYTILGANNASGFHSADRYVFSFSAAGTYTIEINWTNLINENTLVVSLHASLTKQTQTLGSIGSTDVFDGGYVGIKYLKNVFMFVTGYFDSSLSTPFGGQIFPTGGNSGGPSGQIYPA